MKIIITINDIFFIIFVILPITIFLLSAGIDLLKEYYKSKSKRWHNCYKCKYYSFHDTTSAGDTCFYKCKYYNRIDSTTYGNRVRYEKCKNFMKVD